MKKILVIAGGLQLGGAEKVAANLSLYAPKYEFQFHYVVFEGIENVYGREIEENGGKVFCLPSPSKGYFRYIKQLESLIKDNKYDVVHSHTMFNSGINLLVAKLCGVPCRIAHSHTTKTETKVSIAQKAYENVMRFLIRRTATDFLACGVEAGKWMYGDKTFLKRGIMINNGIDTDLFRYCPENRKKIRAEYKISDDAFVIGHSGTLSALKNQELLIRIMPDILKCIPEAVLLLAGNGEENIVSELKTLIIELGIEDKVIFSGGVLNVNEHLSAMDIFAFPSKREGTPLALLEAQCNGLNCIVSKAVPDDALITNRINLCDINKPSDWVDKIVLLKNGKRENCSNDVKAAGFDITESLSLVYQIYKGTYSKARISLSFDDARADNTPILDMLCKNAIPATLNVTSGYVDGTSPEHMRPSNKNPMLKEDIIRLYSTGYLEVAMHGNDHLNSVRDNQICKEKLCQWLNNEGITFGFASPGSGLTVDEFKSPDLKDFRMSVLYMRTSLRIYSIKTVRKYARKIDRIIHLPVLYKIAYSDTIMMNPDGKVIYSVPVLNGISFKEIKCLIKECVKRRGRLVLMFHSILSDTKNEDNWTWSTAKFYELAKYLETMRDQGKLEVVMTKDLFLLKK